MLECKKLSAGTRARGVEALGAGTGQTPSSAIAAFRSFDAALLRARSQAENYARALPSAEGRPPFVVVVDVGHVIEH